MGWGNRERRNAIGKYEQLCWCCDEQLNCEWIQDAIPINGWDAEKDGNTFKIYNCPKFHNMMHSPNEFPTSDIITVEWIDVYPGHRLQVIDMTNTTEEQWEKFKHKIKGWMSL